MNIHTLPKSLLNLLVLISFGCKAQSNYKKKETIFKQIDSIVNANYGDSIFYCSPYLIKKMEKFTKIDATDKAGSFIGKFFFTKETYDEWKKWEKKKGYKY